MNNTFMIASAVAVSLLGTGCATKKYVAQTVAPVESRVTGTEAKNVDQDKQISGQGQQIGEIDRDLSRTKERLTDTDAKAAAAGQAAQLANQRAEGAQKAADETKTYAQQGLERADQKTDQVQHTLERTIEGVNKFKMETSATVLFDLGQSKLTKEGKEQLDQFAKQVGSHERFVIEVQGFTDKTGTADTNERLSQARAQEVARYLANQHKIPVRNITMLGSGYALPVADDSTRDGRKQNRRVEIRLFIPEASVGTSIASAGNKAE